MIDNTNKALFNNWWNLGEKCILYKLSGILADDKIPENDIIIDNTDKLNQFIDKIAEKLLAIL